MTKQVRWITETAVMLALLVTLQAVTKGFGQLVTGSFVNAILAVTVLVPGLSSGITVALISPILAFLLGIAPQILTVPAIMVGNTIYVVLLYLIAGKESKHIFRQIAGWVVSAAAKFGALYAIVVVIICNFMAPTLMEAGLLKSPCSLPCPQLSVGPSFSPPSLVAAWPCALSPSSAKHSAGKNLPSVFPGKYRWFSIFNQQYT